MTFDRLWQGTPLVQTWPMKVLLLALLAAAVFLLPYHVPVAPSISLSYVLQYNNRAALLLFTAGTLLYAALTGGAMGRADDKDRPLRWPHLAVALPVILLLTGGQALRSLSKSAGVESLYAINRTVLLTDGVTPFTGFSYTYGPLELYPPLWLHQLTGRPITTTYYVWLMLQWLLGTAMLWFTVRHLPFRIRWRPLLFWVLLELCLITMPSDGTTYNPVRLVGTAFAAVALARAYKRWDIWRTVTIAFALIAINTAISVDLGLAIAAGTLLWFALLRWKREITAAPLLLLAAAVAVLLLLGKLDGWFIAASMFGAGAYNLPLLPTVHVALTLFVYVAAACAAAFTWRQRDYTSTVLPMALIGLAGLPGAFGRTDEIHLRMSSAAFLLGLAYVQQQVLARRMWTAIATVSYLLPMTLAVAQESRHQASIALHTLAHPRVTHPFAIAMQGEPSMDGMAKDHGWPLFFATTQAPLVLHAPCPVVYFAPTLTPPRGVSPATVCVDTGQFKVAGNLFTTRAIQLKADELLANRRPLLLLDTTLEAQLPTIEDDPGILPRVQGPSFLHPAVKRTALTYGLLVDTIRANYVPDATAENGFRVWRPKS